MDKAGENQEPGEESRINRETNCGKKMKIVTFDLGIYTGDILSDVSTMFTHYSNCHYHWSLATAVILMLPGILETRALVLKLWRCWPRARDNIWKTAFLFLFTVLFFGVGTSVIIGVLNMANVAVPVEVAVGVFFAFYLVVPVYISVVSSTFKTMMGYVALIQNPPAPDGAVRSPELLDGLKGKLRETTTEAALQAILQVSLKMGHKAP